MIPNETGAGGRLADDERKLDRIENQEALIETGCHQGFQDAAVRIHLETDVEALETDIARLKQKASQGQG